MSTRIFVTLTIILLTLLVQRSPTSVSSSTPSSKPHVIPPSTLLQGDAACVYRPSVQRFFCDTARDGGDAEVVVQFGLASDIPLLGDIDGDGRDDPCVYRPSVQRFFCDTARDGGDAEVVVQFGVSGDIPLIGSLGQPFGVALPLVVR